MRGMRRPLVLVLVFFACHDSPKPVTAAKPVAAGSGSATTETDAKPAEAKGLPGWELPAKWRSEIIPFPLGFAPKIAHRGYEELRFPPGFFDPASGDYWSYAFIWRTDDDAVLDDQALAAELTDYFRGLIAAVDDKGRITARDTITATAKLDGSRFKLTAHVFDAFKTALPLDLVGWAERKACASGALWIFVLARETSPIRAQLDAVAATAKC
jgi:hypothetical protein